MCVWRIIFLKPFGINGFNNSKALIIAVQYAAVTILFSLLCNVVIPYLFPKLFEETNWTVLKEIIFLTVLILIVALGNILFTMVMSNSTVSVQLIVNMLKYTFVIGIIPIVLSVLTKQQQLLKKYSKEASEIKVAAIEKDNDKVATIQETNTISKTVFNEQIPQQTSSQKLIQLSGTNQQEILSLYPAEFLFAQASDNYTAIHYTKNGVAKKVLYRTTIKNVETQTVAIEEIFRCHKSYLVNLNTVTQITGNAQGYKLHLGNYNIEIPVSRNLNTTIKQKFAALQVG
jgi:DNA-binding LytR/AlgR family response regulator